MIIYQITNEVNGDFYIGKTTKTLEERFQRHIYNSRYQNDTYLYRSMNKYGVDKFNIKVIESQIDETILDERERHWISELSPPLNLSEGGTGGDTSLSPNFIKSMKEYHSKKPREEYATFGMLGKKQSQKWRDSISKSNSKPISIEGVIYPSITEGEKKYPGIKVRYRIDSPNYPDWFRVKV